jgi:hypothetical protein
LTPGAEPILTQYAREGWVFAAAKVRRDDPQGRSEPHPLSFTFAAQKPVYPLRLTGSAGEPLEVELYVFGHDRAMASGFSAKECRALKPGPTDNRFAMGAWRGTIRHPLLQAWTTNLLVMTKLHARLSPRQLESDASIEWRSAREIASTTYSANGARTMATNYGIFATTLGLIVVWVKRPRWSKSGARWRVAAAMLLGLVVGGVVFAALPVVDVRLVQLPGIVSRNALFQASIEAQEMWLQQPRLELAEFRRAFGELVARGYPDAGSPFPAQRVTFPNPYTGTVMREEDSPGNYLIREREGQVEFVAYDAEGGETVTLLELPML